MSELENETAKELTEYWVTVWQPIMIRFGPVLARSHKEANEAYPEDYGLSKFLLGLEAYLRTGTMPEKCWVELSDEPPVNTLVFSNDEDDVMYDEKGEVCAYQTGN